MRQVHEYRTLNIKYKTILEKLDRIIRNRQRPLIPDQRLKEKEQIHLLLAKIDWASDLKRQLEQELEILSRI